MKLLSPQRLPIRIQIFFLALAIALPATIMLGWFLIHNLEAAQQQAREKVKILASIAASNIELHLRLNVPVDALPADGQFPKQMNLVKLSHELLGSVPRSALVVVVDRNKTIVLRSADPDAYIGKVNAGFDGATGMRQGFLPVSYLDNVQRLNYFQTIPGVQWLVIAGLPEDEVFADYYSTLERTLGIGFAVLLMALALAWRIGASVIHPVADLARTANNIANGDSTARARLDVPPEIAAVARQFNQMLDNRDAIEELLRQSALHTQTILDNMVDGVITINVHGLMESFNQAACAMFGYSSAEVIGRNVSLLMPEPHRSHHDGYLQHYQQTGEARIIGLPRELQGRRRDGSVFPISLSVTRIDRAGEPIFIGLVRDITQHRADIEEIRRLAFYDPLTGLPNRRLLLDRLRHAMVTSERTGQHGALMFLDLDHFKQLNDTLGHDVGDELLKQVANRLHTCVREVDSVARLGGDEFVVLLEGLSAHADEAAAQTEVVASKILAALAQNYALREHSYSSTPSIGIVVFMKDHETMDDLLKKADVAMYQAKTAGRNTARFFDPDMQAAASARSDLEKDLRRGLERGEFVMHYQVQVEIDGTGTTRPTGAEALIRWNNPTRGMVSPAQFIPLAEETGLILPLGQWVLETACAQLAAWAGEAATSEWAMAVNVSAMQFAQPDFVANIALALQKTGARPELLKLELTESMLVVDVQDIIAKMAQIKAQGVRFSLDDFGTGYSSLSYIKRLPLSQLKIDQSFVRDVLTDSSDAVIARTIVALGHSLDLKVIAEGVETAAQRDLLLSIGCDSFQGYFFGRPGPASALLDNLSALV